MERKKLEAYIKRHEERLDELIEWEGAVYRQIKTEKAALSPESLQRARDDLRKDEIIKGLERQINDLKSQIITQQENKERIKEITFHREREETKLGEILSYKEPLLKQKQADEKEAKEAKSKKTAILQEIADKIIGANKEIEAIKSTKQDYVLGLEKKAREIASKEQEITNRELELKNKNQESVKLRNQYGSLLNEVQLEKERLQKADLLTKTKRKDLDKKAFILESQIKETEKTEAESKKKLAEITKEKEFINQTSGLLKLEQESVEKTKKELDERQKRIEDDRTHLYSQQASLRNTLEEFKRKGII